MMGKEITTFKETQERFDPQSGELYSDTKYKSLLQSKEKEDDYIKVYKYTTTVFAFKGISLTLVPAVLEISKYMSYADAGQLVCFNKLMREQICNTLGVSIDRLNQLVRELRKADILRSTKARGVYAVNPFVVGAGPVTKIHELRAHFDFEADLMRTEKKETNFITGKVIQEAIRESAKLKLQDKQDKREKQIPGQLELKEVD